MFTYLFQRFHFSWPSQQQYRILETQKRIDHLRERACRPASLCIRRTRVDSDWRLKKTETIAATPTRGNVIGEYMFDAESLQPNCLRHEISNMQIANFDRSFRRYKNILDAFLAQIECHFTTNINIPINNAISVFDHIFRIIIVNTDGCRERLPPLFRTVEYLIRETPCLGQWQDKPIADQGNMRLWIFRS